MKRETFPLVIVQALHASGVQVSLPLALPEITRLEAKPEVLAQEFQHAVDQDLLRRGRYQELLGYLLPADLSRDEVEVQLAPYEDGLYPELSLKYPFWVVQGGASQLLGYIPLLGLQVAAPDRAALRERLEEALRLEFLRHKRLGSVASLISTQWFEHQEVKVLPVDLSLYTLTELENIQHLKKESLLSQVARPFVPTKPACYGLEGIYEQMGNALNAQEKGSLVLVGPSGQGKSALIHHFIYSQTQGALADIRVWEVTAAQLLHRLTGTGGWEGRLGQLCQELRDSGDWLYVPDYAEMFEVGQYAGNSMSIGDYLRPYLARNEITVITECTPQAANQIELRAPGYWALFTRIDWPELSDQALQDIVLRKAQHLVEQRGCRLSEAAIRETLRLQQWFTPYSGLPGKTIQFLDALLTERAKRGQEALAVPDIYARFCQETGLPAFIIDPEHPLDIQAAEDFFRQNIYGQDEAIRIVLDLLVSIKAAVIRRGKPLASLLFAGPTGVGKTEMAKVLAQYIFGQRERMIRFDMSEYRDLPSLLRLTGDDGRSEGLLTSAVRQNPFSVILLDELEKVNPLFYDLLLQIIGEGRLTSATGRVADFCSTVIIMTSNLGAQDFQHGGVGFGPSQDAVADATAHFRSAVQAHFRPELFNRLDRIIAFAPLDRVTLRRIVDRELGLVQQREGIRGRRVSLELAPEAIDYLGEQGYHPLYGARFLQRCLQNELIIPLARALNLYTAAQTLVIRVALDPTGGLSLEVEKAKAELVSHRSVGAGNLNLGQIGELITHERRRLGAMEQGAVYVRFNNQLDQLQRQLDRLKRKQKEAAFWKLRISRWYSEGLALRETYRDLQTQICELEMDTLMLLEEWSDLDPPTLLQRYNRYWYQRQAWTTDLIKAMYPQWNQCVIGIYGPAEGLIELAELYVHLAERQGFAVRAYYLWYSAEDDAILQEALLKDDPLASELSAYRREKLRLEHPQFEHPARGIELFVQGNLAFPYFSGEGGACRWRPDEDQEEERYQIVVQPVALKDYRTPREMHRREFLRSHLPRRIFVAGERIVQEKEYDFGNDEGPLPFVLYQWLQKHQEHQINWELGVS